jgi:predicted Zn-dependent protease
MHGKLDSFLLFSLLIWICFSYDDNAETECQKALDASLQHNPNNPDTYCLLASLRISQQKPKEEAISFLNMWKEKAEKEKPEYEQRFNAARIFMELGEFQSAVDILEELVEEEDCIAEVWYTMGAAYKGNFDLQHKTKVEHCE